MNASDPTTRRRVRWAIRGALVLAALAIVLGLTFNILIAIALREIPPGAGIGFWAIFLLRGALAWGGGALFFGAVLGMFASMIWKDDSA
jgi:hypothetical protein